MRILRTLYSLFSSTASLFWLMVGWLLYYVSLAIWTDEAFAAFVRGVETNLLIQIPFVLFLLSGYMNVIRAFRGRYRAGKTGFIAWLTVSCGIMLYLTGFFLSMNIRQFDSRLVGQGDSVRLPWSTEAYRVNVVNSGLKDRFTQTDSGVLDREPKMVISDGSSRLYEIGAYPPVRIGWTYFHILNFGIAPGVRFYKDDVLVNSGYMALRLLPPGRSDFFDLRPYPYRFLVNMLPGERAHGGQYPEPVFNLRDPLYNTRVFRGEKVIAEGDSLQDLRFEGFAINYFEPRIWIQLDSARDAGIPVIRLGVFLFVFGIPFYIIRLIAYVLSCRGRSGV